MTFFDTTKSFIENLYLISGPVIGLLGFFIFRQIRLAKEQIKIAKEQLIETQRQMLINSKRDSIKLAAEQVRFYLDTIVGYSNEAYGKMKELGVERMEIKATRFIAAEIYESANLKEVADYLRKIKQMTSYDLKILNSLEIFSTYFVQKVADEKVAFHSVGESFCEVVEGLSFSLAAMRDAETSYYNNTIVLYRLWKGRIDNKNLEFQKEALHTELIEKMQNIEAKIKMTQQSDIKPLGTE